jgi:hypothetical protein
VDLGGNDDRDDGTDDRHPVYAGAVACALIGGIAAVVWLPAPDAFPGELTYRLLFGVIVSIWLLVFVAAVRHAYHDESFERLSLLRIFEIVFSPVANPRKELDVARDLIGLQDQLREVQERLDAALAENRKLSNAKEAAREAARIAQAQLRDLKSHDTERIAELEAENRALRRRRLPEAGSNHG